MAQLAGSLDANVLLRLLTNDIPAQHDAVKQLIGSTQQQFAVADTAIIEVVFVMSRAYGMTRGDIVRVVMAFMRLTQINCNRALFDRALEHYQAHSALSLEDCCLEAYAWLNGAAPLYTFDKKLARQLEHVRAI